MLEHEALSKAIIGAAIEVHRHLGPGLLESAYELCLHDELSRAGLGVRRQVELPLEYKGRRLDCGYRLDLIVESAVIVEVKTVERFDPIHEAQMLTYLRLTGCSLGLLLNFHRATMLEGLKRVVLANQKSLISAPSASSR
ncbi:MAG: GxxExxY protein [Planctomycetes bacterium]|nr:GxxExxY protein [Planctomycetota bacterium]